MVRKKKTFSPTEPTPVPRPTIDEQTETAVPKSPNRGQIKCGSRFWLPAHWISSTLRLLVIFRIGSGLILFWEVCRCFSHGWIKV